MKPEYHETQYGFKWGVMEIIRVYSDENGSILLQVETPRQSVDLWITPTGLIKPGKVYKRFQLNKQHAYNK